MGEVIRGIRQHFAKLVKGFSASTSDKSQLGLSRSYSRAKVKFNVNKSDNMIIQSIALLDQLDKDINTFCMRIREWYSYHFPELIKIVPENALYAKVVKLVKNRKELTAEKLEGLEAILMDSARAQAVIDASKSSMGMDISPVDLLNIDMFASRVIGITEYRKELSTYLRSKMSVVVQILGAEKALFRALKTKGNTPKYGLIFHSSFIGRAGAKNKGRISRYLANKCSIASRIDCFSEESTTIFGTKLKEQVEDRLKFYETGDLPRKNVEVMAEAVEEAAEDAKKKKKKEKKKRKAEDAEESVTEDVATTEEPPKKKKKKNKDKEGVAEAAETTVNTTADVEDETPKKKKKNKKNKQEQVEVAAAETTVNTTAEAESPKKKKKKSKNTEDEGEANGDVSLEEVVPAMSEKKKKKKKNKEVEA